VRSIPVREEQQAMSVTPGRQRIRSAVFIGPTLPRTQVAQLTGADILPPAARGDLYAAVQAGYTRILLIDGLFEGVPSVGHKEILFALDRRVLVAGCSSMGALRAAELADLGMAGRGRVFQWYRSGVCESDDEVAVTHGPAAAGYPLFSVPLVNVRHATAEAVLAGVLDEHQATAVTRLTRELFYPDRTWDRILRTAVERGTAPTVAAALAEFVAAEPVDLKALDAVCALNEFERHEIHAQALTPWRFEATHSWEMFLQERRSGRGPEQAGPERMG
jgi:hypothetical protein